MADIYRVTPDVLSVEEAVASVTDAAVGAVATFVGVVRGTTEGRQVRHLEYEAYPEMAERMLAQIGKEIRARWPDILHVAMIHRIGRLEIGETAVVIALAAAHRPAVFDALRFAIDRLKEIVPIWKKEIWVDGEEWRSER